MPEAQRVFTEAPSVETPERPTIPPTPFICRLIIFSQEGQSIVVNFSIKVINILFSIC
jgi:hypothetical protein